MNLTGRMCGVDVVYGGRWDDLAGDAAFKVTHNGVTGYFDGRNMDLSLVPAPAVAQRAAGSDDDGMAQAIFYYDESASIFGSVIFSGGKIAPLSETIHDDVDAWAAAIESSLKDPNLDIVHVPKEIIAPKVEKVRLYDLGQMVDRKKLPRLSSTSSLRNLVGGLLITLLMSGIAMGAWTYLSKRLTPPEPEIVMVREIASLFSETSFPLAPRISRRPGLLLPSGS